MKRLLLLLALCCMPFDLRAEIAIVVAKDSALRQLDFDQVANIFLARTKRLPSGDWAAPIELIDARFREAFYLRISGKSTRQLNAYWATLVFTGKGKPPQSCGDADELSARLAAQPGAISYLPTSMVTEEMRIVHAFRPATGGQRERADGQGERADSRD